MIPDPSYVQIVLFGASMTWSMRAPYGQRYADCLEDALRQRLGAATVVDVAACGAGGNTAREGLPRVERDVVAYRPDVVVVSFGANDAGREEKRVFEHAYEQVLQALADRTDALVIVETTPVLDEEWHAYRDREFARAAGGLNRHLEAFSHSFIRRIAAERGLRVHDRFRIYHEALTRDPALREQLIRRDGVHLTEAGNAYFAATLADLVAAALPDPRPETAGEAAAWLQRARTNPAFVAASAAAEGPQALRAVLLGDDPAMRLLLQQARSHARRAQALAGDEPTRAAAGEVEALAAAFLAAQRIANPATPLAASGSRAWARAHLARLTTVPAGLQELCGPRP